MFFNFCFSRFPNRLRMKQSIRFFLPVLLASNSLGSSLLTGTFTNLAKKSCFSSNYQLKSNFLKLFDPKFPVCKMSTNIKEEVNHQKDFYDSMTLDEKRKLYACRTKYVTLDEIPSWKEENYSDQSEETSNATEFKINDVLNSKVSIFIGDITSLEIDAIVNAANSRLRSGGGVDGAIHNAAGRQLLLNETSLQHNGLATGKSLLTSGYRLPAKRIIHTVGPIGEIPDLLKNCYENSLNLARSNNLRTIAFPCISTGVYGYPNKNAAQVAIKTVREWLEKNADSIDRVIFCLFLPIDVEIYKKLLPVYFPK